MFQKAATVIKPPYSRSDLYTIGLSVVSTSLVFLVAFAIVISIEHKVTSAEDVNACDEVDTKGFSNFQKPEFKKASEVASNLSTNSDDLKKNGTELKNKKADLVKLAAKRKADLVATMYTMPQVALGSTLSQDQLKDIGQVAPGCFEKETEVEGSLKVFHADNFKDGTSATDYRLVTADKQEIKLHPVGQFNGFVESRTKVKVRGIKIDNELVFNARSTIAKAMGPNGGIDILEQPGNPPVMGNQRLFLIAASFQNVPVGDIKSLLDNQEAQMIRDYYRQTSHNTIDITPSSYGPITLPINQTCDEEQIWSKAIWQASRDINFQKGDRVLVYAPTECYFAGTAQIGQNEWVTQNGIVTMSAANVASSVVGIGNVSEHELGHQFGMGHASYLVCGTAPLNGNMMNGDCHGDEYGDRADVMGTNNNGYLNAIHQEQLGWLDSASIPTVSSSGNYTLNAIETDSGTRAIKIPRGNNQYLYIELRSKYSYDYELESDYNNGVLLHIIGDKTSSGDKFIPGFDVIFNGNETYKTLLLGAKPTANSNINASLSVGSSFVDPANGTKISVTNFSAATPASPATATVNVLLAGTLSPSCDISPTSVVVGKDQLSVSAPSIAGVLAQGDPVYLWGAYSSFPIQIGTLGSNPIVPSALSFQNTIPTNVAGGLYRVVLGTQVGGFVFCNQALSVNEPPIPTNLSLSWNRPVGYASFAGPSYADVNVAATAFCTSSDMNCSVPAYTFQPGANLYAKVRADGTNGPILVSTSVTSVLCFCSDAGSVSISWNWQYGVAFYPDSQGACNTSDCKTTSVNNNNSTNNVVMGGLTPNILYHKVVCVPDCGSGNILLDATESSQQPKPAIPNSSVILACSAATSGNVAQAYLSWNHAIGAIYDTQYTDLSFSNNNFATGTFNGIQVDPMTSGKALYNLPQNTKYYWRVNSHIQNGAWVPSQTGQFTTPNCVSLAYSPPAPILNQFTGQYFASSNFTNEKVVKTDSKIDFNWGTGSPSLLISSSSSYSARWTGAFNISTATYQFLVKSDGSVKVLLDGKQIIDQTASGTTSNNLAVSGGTHVIEVDYVHSTGSSNIYFDFVNAPLADLKIVNSTDTTSPLVTTSLVPIKNVLTIASGVSGEITVNTGQPVSFKFNTRNVGTGDATVATSTTVEAPGSTLVGGKLSIPVAALVANTSSAVNTQLITWNKTGTYNLIFRADSGSALKETDEANDVLLKVNVVRFDSDNDGFDDGLENIMGTNPLADCGTNAWPVDFNSDLKANTTDDLILAKNLGSTNPRYDLNGDGKVDILDQQLEGSRAGLCGYSAQYFDNADFTGTMVAKREPAVKLYLTLGATPDPSIAADTYSAVFSKSAKFDAAVYRFNVNSVDTGVKVFVDGGKIMDNTVRGVNSVALPMTAGLHDIRLEFVHNTGDTNLTFNYVRAYTCADLTADGNINSTDLLVESKHPSATGFTAPYVNPWDVNGDNASNSLDLLIISKLANVKCL